jgi:hypothetical protein
MTATSQSSAPTASELTQSSVGVRAILNIARRWHLNDRDLGILLGGVSVPSI